MMADVKNGVVTLELGGKERKLKYTLYSLSMLEEAGVKLSDLGKEMSMKQVMKVLWAGLVTFEKDLTPEEVGAMVGVEDIPMISEKLTEAFEGLKGKN